MMPRLSKLREMKEVRGDGRRVVWLKKVDECEEFEHMGVTDEDVVENARFC